MEHNNPVPQDADAFEPYVDNLFAKLVGAAASPAALLAASLNIPAGDLTILTNIRNMITGMSGTVEQIQQRTKDVNAFWRWFLRGPVNPDQPLQQSFPAALAWSSPPITVIGNAMGWVGKFVTRLKTQANCTDQVRADLHLDGSAVPPADPQTWKPMLECTFTAGHPVIDWPRRKGARLEIWRQKPNSAYDLADIDDVPVWKDPSPLPPPGTAEIWNYKGIYRLNGEQVGQWSDECEVSVKG